MKQTDLFSVKSKINNNFTPQENEILNGPDYGFFEKHRKVPSIHRLIRFNSKIKLKNTL